MMKKGIYIESKLAEGGETHGRRHLYLVYRDGEGGERVIRGGPEADFLVGGDIETQADESLSISDDRYGRGVAPQTRRARLLDLDGMDPEIIWRQMTAAAKQIEARGPEKPWCASGAGRSKRRSPPERARRPRPQRRPRTTTDLSSAPERAPAARRPAPPLRRRGRRER